MKCEYEPCQEVAKLKYCSKACNQRAYQARENIKRRELARQFKAEREAKAIGVHRVVPKAQVETEPPTPIVKSGRNLIVERKAKCNHIVVARENAPQPEHCGDIHCDEWAKWLKTLKPRSTSKYNKHEEVEA